MHHKWYTVEFPRINEIDPLCPIWVWLFIFSLQLACWQFLLFYSAVLCAGRWGGGRRHGTLSKNLGSAVWKETVAVRSLSVPTFEEAESEDMISGQ